MLRFTADYREVVTLNDGREVLLRLVRPDDKPLLLAGFAKLSATGRLRRFLVPKNELSQAELRYFTEVDQDNHFALGAALVVDGHEEGIGVARFVRYPDDRQCAEPAVAVVDDMQGKGLGRLLLMRLTQAALERGVTRFRCYLLAENVTVKTLFKELWPAGAESYEGAVSVIDFTLAPAEPEAAPSDDGDRGEEQSGRPLQRALAMAAAQIIRLQRLFFGPHEPAESAPPESGPPESQPPESEPAASSPPGSGERDDPAADD